MKTHTTNYTDTFIEVADDCPAGSAQVPPVRGDNKTIAGMQYDLLHKHPYRFTSDDVLFQVYADRNDLTKTEYKAAREAFFSKGQPCMRTSPLTKRYGWGVHSNTEGKIALVGRGTKDYEKFSKDKKLQHVKAMRSAKN